MKHKRRIFSLAIAVPLLAGLVWATLAARDPIFHGKPESQWITNIAYGMSLSEDRTKAQIQCWRDFGPEGLQVLGRGLAPKRGLTYARLHDRFAKMLPNAVLRLLPAPPPKTVGGTRLCVIDLLCRMGEDARPVWPAVARALTDEDPWVRSRAINFFSGSEDDKAYLNQMPAAQKAELLPLFLHAMEDRGWCWNLRNNAAVALRYYPEQAPRVVPVVVRGLQDSSPYVRLSSAQALNRVDPAAGSKAGAVTVVAQLLQNPDYQLSGSAAFALRAFQQDAEAAVSALIEALHGTNRTVVGASAVWSLQHAFPRQADRIIPELRKAAELNDNAGNYAKGAMKGLESNANH